MMKILNLLNSDINNNYKFMPFEGNKKEHSLEEGSLVFLDIFMNIIQSKKD